MGFNAFSRRDLALFDKYSSLRRDPLQQFRCRFFVRTLLHQLAAHGQVKDGLTQGLDLACPGGERSEVFESEGGVVPEYGWVGIGRVEAGEDRPPKPVPRRLPLCPCCLQPVAERHQFIDLGDDTVLFGERGEGD